MGGDSLDVRAGGISAVAQWIDDSAAEFGNDVEDVMRRVRAVLGGDWSGRAANSHDEPWRDWYRAATNLVGALEGDATLLRSAAAGYQATDIETTHTIVTVQSPGIPGLEV